jgi:LDH2 family malate/lactate/ureidoglycolate dehydrogenase
MATGYVPVEMLHGFMADVFKGLGTPEEEAKISADVLIASDLRGIPSHGIQRLKMYYDRIVNGQHRAITVFEVVKDEGATAVVDGHHGNGHVISKKSMQLAIEKAKKYGIGMVVTRDSTHYGIAGYYALQAIEQGCIGITGTNARPSVAPTFGTEPILGTNPLTFGFPTDEFPFLLDCATSIIQRGKVEVYSREKRPLPSGVVIDRETGELRTDTDQVLEDLITKKAALLPLGGAGEELAGYKGYGYCTVVEILSAALQGGRYLKQLSGIGEKGEKTHFHLGHFFIAIDPEHFMGLDTFKKIAGNICRELRNSDRAPYSERIYTAGEKEYESEKRVREEGVLVNESVQRDLITMRDELSLTQYRFPFE